MTSTTSPQLLLVGGQDDPNLVSLINAAKRKAANIEAVLVGKDSHPVVDWHLNQEKLWVNGKKMNPTGMFIRFDVFSAMRDPRPEVSQRAQRWYCTLLGVGLANPVIKMLNKDALPVMGNKPAILILAQQCGLRIPNTRVTNYMAEFLREPHKNSDLISKPVDGGDFCMQLDEVLSMGGLLGDMAACPAIIQNKLCQPELRIYRIGKQLIAFNMQSESLDYRVKQDAKIQMLKVPPKKEAKGLVALLDKMNMDFAAADFKTDPDTGELCFLEVNSSPMFSRFDYESKGALSDAMIDCLLTK